MHSTGWTVRIPIWLCLFILTSLKLFPIQAKVVQHSYMDTNEVALNLNGRASETALNELFQAPTHSRLLSDKYVKMFPEMTATDLQVGGNVTTGSPWYILRYTGKFPLKSESMPLCTKNAICGYLQANVRGINQQKLCACPPGESQSCPMAWDPVDGHSLTQGSDQYKFCGAPPSVSVCGSGQRAYTSRMVFSKETEETLDKSDYVHCICPEGSNYVMANQNFEDLDADSEMMIVTFTCAPLSACEIGDYCKAVTEKSSEFLVDRKCQCPSGLRCPTISEHGAKTVFMGSGIIHYIKCQR